LDLALESEGNRSAARIAIIATTTSNSIKLKPRGFFIITSLRVGLSSRQCASRGTALGENIDGARLGIAKSIQVATDLVSMGCNKTESLVTFGDW
jgi:hypothetical protein